MSKWSITNEMHENLIIGKQVYGLAEEEEGNVDVKT